MKFYWRGTCCSNLFQDDGDVELAKKIMEKTFEDGTRKPYAFRFITRSRKDDELDSKVTDRSGYYYLEGSVLNLEQVEKQEGSNSILACNMRNNHWDKVVMLEGGWTQPLYENDVIL